MALTASLSSRVAAVVGLLLRYSYSDIRRGSSWGCKPTVLTGTSSRVAAVVALIAAPRAVDVAAVAKAAVA